jgi:hypothetical protein
MTLSLRTRIAGLAFTALAVLVVGCPTASEPEAPTDDAGVLPDVNSGPPCNRLTTPCPAGEKCEGAPDCTSGLCRDGKCNDIAPADGAKSGDETDVDCGGTHAPACADNKGCLIAADCMSSVCKGGLCQVPSPTDGVKNGDETGLDCGGSKAPKCAPGQGCLVTADCDKVKCDTVQKKCLPPAHDDRKRKLVDTGLASAGTAATTCATPSCAAR